MGYRSSAFRRFAAFLVVPALALALAGCFGRGDKKTDESIVEAAPPDLLYNEALAHLQAGDTRAASDKFDEIDKEHPYSEYARRSTLMSAFISFRKGNYQDCINDAQRYVTLFPASPDASYAYYLIGESYFRQIPDVTRDQDMAAKAIAAMNEVVRKYPDSEYAADARQKIGVAEDQLAGKEMQIGRYYMERKEYLAGVNRFKVVVEQYQTTRHVEEALERLTEAYLSARPRYRRADGGRRARAQFPRQPLV